MSGYICGLNKNAERTHVRYNNRYGIALAGDLYTAKALDKNKKYPALIVGAPYGGVKEQGPCVYAGELAQRGFIVLTFDPCYMGESAGEPRRVSSPDLFSENFSAGAVFLGLLPYVDREKIGAVGICGSGGFALSAAAVDTRIKAVVTASMYDMSYAARAGQTPEQIAAAKERLSLQRWKDAENGYPEYIPSFQRCKESRRRIFPTKCRASGGNFMNFTLQSAGTTPTPAADLPRRAISPSSIIRCCIISVKYPPAPFSLSWARKRRADFSPTSPTQTPQSRRNYSSFPTATTSIYPTIQPKFRSVKSSGFSKAICDERREKRCSTCLCRTA